MLILVLPNSNDIYLFVYDIAYHRTAQLVVIVVLVEAIKIRYILRHTKTVKT